METYIHWRLIGNVPDLENTVGLRLHNFLFKQLYYSALVTVHPDNFGNNPREKYFSEKPASCKCFSQRSRPSALGGGFIKPFLLLVTLIPNYTVTGVAEGCHPSNSQLKSHKNNNEGYVFLSGRKPCCCESIRNAPAKKMFFRDYLACLNTTERKE